MPSRAFIFTAFMGCFFLTCLLLENHTRNAVIPSAPSSLSMNMFDEHSKSQDTRFKDRELDEYGHHALIDGNIKEIQSHARILQVKSALVPDSQELILLASTLGRGGSSWIGELLSNMKDEVMYVFEPLKMVSDLYKSRVTPTYTSEIISQVFSCQFSKDFVTFQSRWPMNFKKFPDDCKTGCKTPNSISRRCRLAETVVVKTIRMPLSHVEDLLSKPSFRHLKIIYLARDPRAQVLSRSHVFSLKNPDFNNECPRIESDVFAFHRLSQLFPGHFYFMRYEDMCQDPLGEAAQLWRFLRTNHTAEMPASWTTFLSEHLQRPEGAKKKENPYSTFRDTSAEWYKWRLEMKNSTMKLLDVEKECEVAMEKLGYIPLRTLTNLKNLSIPFIKKYNCDFWNCWSYKF